MIAVFQITFDGKGEPTLLLRLDGKGRDFIRLSFEEMEKHSKPWR